MSAEKFITEAITSESELITKLTALSERDIFEFMQNLRGGTYFNMGMFSSIKPAKAYNKTTRIYKVLNMTAVVSGVSYENIGTTKEFRDRTGKAPGKSWYSHVRGFENKVGQKNSDPSSKYVLWDVKASTDTWVRFFLVDIATGVVTPISKESIEKSDYLTETEKAKLRPKKVEGFDKETGELVENQTTWRTAKFENIFWLSQAGKNTKEYGTKFTEDMNTVNNETLKEARGEELFRDAHAGIRTDLDAILSGSMDEAYQKSLKEHHYPELEDWFCDECGKKMDYDRMYQYTNEDGEEELICSECHDKLQNTGLDESLEHEHRTHKNLKEAYRRIITVDHSLVDNELFVDFE